MIELHFVVNASDQGMRLDRFLTQLDDLPLTRSQIKKHLGAHEVMVNGQPATKAGYQLRQGDVIQWHYTPHLGPSLEPQDIPITILHEDAYVAIVDKPAGMVVHPSAGHPDKTLVNALLYHFAHSGLSDINQSEQNIRPGIVHRIDKDTTGALAIAKTNQAHVHLAQLFRTHTIERTYHALVYAPGLPEQGSFDTLHGRDPKHRIRFTSNVNRGKHAITHWRCLERFSQGEVALVECRLETGRTHQIRMHFFDDQHPLLGDTLYGNKATMGTKLISRQALHAKTLGFEHVDGSLVRVEAPYPDDFAHALSRLRDGKSWR